MGTSLQSNGLNDNDIFDVDEVDLRTGNSNNGKIVQVGVTAWGIECAREGMPSVYSSVTDAQCWIDQISSCYGLNKPLSIKITRLSYEKNETKYFGVNKSDQILQHRNRTFLNVILLDE